MFEAKPKVRHSNKNSLSTFCLSLWKPETALFALGIVASTVVVGLILLVVWVTFLEGMPGAEETHLSLRNYSTVLSDSITARAALNTLLLGTGTVLVSLFFSVPLAWLMHRTNIPYKTLFLTLMFLHITIPSFLKTISWIFLLSPSIGIINQLLRNFIPVDTGPLSIYNIPGMVFLQGLTFTPVMFFMISGAMMAVDPALEESAEAAGLTRLQTLLRVTIPLVRPVVLAAIIYTFMSAVSIYEIPALLGSPSNIHVFSTVIYSTVHAGVGLPEYGLAAVYGLMVLVPMLAALYFYQRMLRHSHRYVTVTGRGYRPKLADLGSLRWVGVGFAAIFFALDIFIPFLTLVWVSLSQRLQVPSIAALASLTVEAYGSAVGMLTGGVFVNTVLLMVSVATLTMVASLIISWIVVRTRLPGRYIMDTVSMLPHAVPHVVFAFSVAFLGMLLIRTVPLYASLGAIVLAHSACFISFGTRSLSGALVQIHRDLDDAALVSGASRVVVLRTIILPLLSPALFYSTIWVSLLSYREVTMALFLQSPRNMVLSVNIWQLWGAAKSAEAAALGVVMILVLAAILVIGLRTVPQFFYRQHTTG